MENKLYIMTKPYCSKRYKIMLEAGSLICVNEDNIIKHHRPYAKKPYKGLATERSRIGRAIMELAVPLTATTKLLYGS